METILNRRSIRKYLDKKVSQKDIKDILKAGMSAPSAGNQQPWHFIVIDDRDILKKISNIHPHADMVKNAPVSILTCGNTEDKKHEGFWVQDCSAATENMLIAIQDKGLGGVWIGIYPRKERVHNFKKMFKIPDKIIPFSLIALGYPAEEKPPADRYHKSKIFKNKWGELL